ncbi:MAG: BamA/TamA family outer membrane protein [Myxococcota bacterium]|nr:BamA/TamA family outer membrane protein [Myxococcota bacterium]
MRGSRTLAGIALAGLALAAPSGAEQAVRPAGNLPPETPAEYDPFAGIDQDGRIPNIVRPTDMPHPERWRYIPEGRIKPGNLFERFLVTSFIAPFVAQDKDVGTSFGIAITDIDFRQQRRREFAGIFLSYSTEGEQSYSMIWQRWLNHRDREGGGVFQEERSRVRARLGYHKARTVRFFGLGPDTTEFDETSYTDEFFEVDLAMELSWPEAGDDLILAGGIRGEFHELGSGKRFPSMNDPLFSSPAALSEFAEAEHSNLGWLYWGVRYDTRDSQANPYRGWMLGTLIEAALLQNGGDVGVRYASFGRFVLPLPGLFHRGAVGDEEHPPTDTLAFALDVDLTSGELPFFWLNALGGDSRMRGFIANRFTDDSLWWGAAEYRFWVLPRGFPIPFTRALRVERVGLAAWYELGSVAGSGSGLFHARVHQSYGVGLRFTLERQAPFRIDVGFSDEDIILTARFGLPF